MSCEEPNISHNPISEKYQEALDTLVNYDDYFIGEFNGELLVSNETFSIGRVVGNTALDSVTVQFSYSYKISNSVELKTPFISFRAYETINKFDSSNYYRYNEYSDFYTFFNRSELEYHEVDDPKNLTPEIIIRFIDYTQLINNSGIEYQSTDFGKPPFIENVFDIESVREIESPEKGIQLTYSFNCTISSDSNDLIEIKKGRGKCTFWY